jgi:hypothetical protein
MAWDASKFGINPFPGARSDQPAGLLLKMRVLSNAYDAMSAAKEYNRMQKVADFHSHPLFDTYIEIMNMRDQHGRITDKNHASSG